MDLPKASSQLSEKGFELGATQQQRQQMRAEYLLKGGRDVWVGFTSTDYAHHSAATPPDCETSCLACDEQFVPKPYREFADYAMVDYCTDEEARGEIASLIAGTKENLHHVRRDIDEYGDTIAKRWQKKNVAKRAAVIRKASRNIPSYALVGVEMYFAMSRRNATQLRQQHAPETDPRITYEDWNLSHWLDVDAINKGNNLLALMHHRSHSPVEDWFQYDRLELQSSFCAGAFATKYNPHCVVTYGKHFGELVQWEKEASHRGHMIGFPCARQVFLAQNRISAFLHDMVDLILGDTKQDASIGREVWDSLLAASFSDPTTLIASSAYRSQPFLPPPKFDHQKILNIAKSRFEAAEDELIQMQSEPSQFRTLLQLEKCLTKCASAGRQHMVQALSMVPLRIFTRFIIWKFVRTRIDKFLTKMAQFEQPLEERRELPKQYEDALDTLEGTLCFQRDVLLKSISKLSDSLPYYRKGAAEISTIEAGRTVKTEEIFRKDRLVWALNELMKPGMSTPGTTPEALVAFLDEQSKEEMARMNQSLYDYLGDIAALSEMLDIIQHHPSRRGALLDRRKMMDAAEHAVTSVCLGQLPKHYRKSSSELDSLQESLETFMSIKVPNLLRPDVGDLNTNVALHKALISIWNDFDSLVVGIFTNAGLEPRVIASLMNDRLRISNGQEYVENFVREQQDIVKAVHDKNSRGAIRLKNLAATGKSDEFVPVIEDTTNQLKSCCLTPKVKTKTRPAEPSPLQDADGQVSKDLALISHSKPSHTRTQLAVTAASLKIFLPMFSRLESKKQGTTRWDDFVRAMADAGLSATHGGGSAVAFEDKDQKASIVIHQPHPDPTLDLIKLRSIGKRLTKWFDWDESTFSQRGRDTS